MSNTTNIFDLPVDPAGPSNGNGASNTQNVSMSANEVIATPPQQQPIPSSQPPSQPPVGNDNNVTLDQATISNIVSGIQQASNSGSTQLPSRDIPTSTNHISQDQQITPAYIPPTENTDYIQQHEDNEDIINDYNKQVQNSNALDTMYDELQTPLLLAVLFFLFQLPFFKKYMFMYLPMFFLNDGNYNIYGFVFMSIMFAFVFYLLQKTMNNFNTF